MSCNFLSKCLPLSMPRGSSGALAIALAVCGTSQQLHAQDESVKKAYTVVVNGTAEVDDEDAVEATPKFWLGILLKEIEGDLATYLGSDHGVLVDSVFPDSPAEAAGLNKGDILLMMGDDELDGPADLLAVMQELNVEDGKPSALVLTLLRKGKEVQLELTPAPRPEEAEAKQVVEVQIDANNLASDSSNHSEVDGVKTFSFSFSGDVPDEEMKALLGKINQGSIEKSVNVLRLGSPSMVWVPSESTEGAEVKQEGEMTIIVKKDVDGEKYEITVQRTDDKPAKITVKSGDEVQEFMEDKMDEVSEETRTLVEPILKKQVVRRMNIAGGQAIDLSGIRQAVSGVEAEKISEAWRRTVAEMQSNGQMEALKAKAMASAQEARALAAAVQEQVRAQAQIKSQAPAEVEELKKLIEKLRAEVEQLRKQVGKSK